MAKRKKIDASGATPFPLFNILSVLELHSAMKIESFSDTEREMHKQALDRLERNSAEISRCLAKISDEELAAQICWIADEIFSDGIFIGKYTTPLKFTEKLLRQETASKAGKSSGARRAKKAAETWEIHALKLALASRKENKGWSQDDVAHYVLEHWGKEKGKPGHRSLKKRISDWIKKGSLPEKVRQ